METPVFGFGVNSTALTTIKLFSDYALEHKKRNLNNVSPSKVSQVEAWMKITNGIYGTRYGMHVDNAEVKLIRDAVKNWLKQVGKKPWKL